LWYKWKLIKENIQKVKTLFFFFMSITQVFSLINLHSYFNWALVQWIPMSLIIITVLQLLIWVTKLSQLWCTFRPVVVRFVLHYQIQILYGIIALESPSHIPYWLVRRVYDLYNSGLSIVIIHSASILRYWHQADFSIEA